MQKEYSSYIYIYIYIYIYREREREGESFKRFLRSVTDAMEEEAEIQENHDLPEFSWEERSLHLLQNSRLDKGLSASPSPFSHLFTPASSSTLYFDFSDFAKLKCPRKGGKKHRVRCMSKPMAIPEVILELQEPIVRESALRCLSTFLLEVSFRPQIFTSSSSSKTLNFYNKLGFQWLL